MISTYSFQLFPVILSTMLLLASLVNAQTSSSLNWSDLPPCAQALTTSILMKYYCAGIGYTTTVESTVISTETQQLPATSAAATSSTNNLATTTTYTFTLSSTSGTEAQLITTTKTLPASTSTSISSSTSPSSSSSTPQPTTAAESSGTSSNHFTTPEIAGTAVAVLALVVAVITIFTTYKRSEPGQPRQLHWRYGGSYPVF